MRWVGIDEAGYGPNLGPLVMTAVVVESCDAPDGRPPIDHDPPRRLWDDLGHAVRRAGRALDDRFAVDDSKAILKGGKGREALLATCLALLHAVGRPLPGDPDALIDLVARPPADPEIARWLDPNGPPRGWPGPTWIADLGVRLSGRPFSPATGAWRFAEVMVEVVGPERFNEGLARTGSKAAVHFEAFARLLREVWGRAGDGRTTIVRGDKHGGRHYYLHPLQEAFPGDWIDRGSEGPASSEYHIRATGRSMSLRLTPRADADDALVALASIASKAVRECWMDVFNGYWTRRVPGLKPSAGYPVDASRFRLDVESAAEALGIPPRCWWRER